MSLCNGMLRIPKKDSQIYVFFHKYGLKSKKNITPILFNGVKIVFANLKQQNEILTKMFLSLDSFLCRSFSGNLFLG